jgi:hypothetical protein
MCDNTDRLIDEIVKAIGEPKALLPVKIDNEAIRMIYEKVGEPVPVYQCEWVDFYRDWFTRTEW